VRRRAALALASLAACATAPRGGPDWSFPDAFEATQVVEVHGERGNQVLLASVWRDAGRFEITFLDPVLQTPLVSARVVGGAFVEERFVDFPMTPSDVEALLRDVAALHESQSIRMGASGGSVRLGRWKVTLSPPAGGDACPFPERINLRIDGRPLPWIAVRTLDVRCSSR
jgi:hypothetical protein